MAERTDAQTDPLLESPVIRIDRVDAPDASEAGREGAADVDPGAIRADIRETRELLGDTLEQIGERLSPSNIKEQVKENIHDATIGKVQTMARSAADRVNDTRFTVMDTIRDNPIPAALIGVGLGWIVANRRRRSLAGSRFTEAGYSSSSGPYERGRPTTEATAAGFMGAGGGERGAGDVVRDRASEVGHQLRETAGGVADRVQGAAGEVADRAQDIAGNVSQQAQYQARRLEDQFNENPLALGVATLALGVAAGLALPATDREVRLMGDARDQLVDRVRSVAHETTEKVQHVAGRVVDEARSTARDAAREEGLTA